jgi:hypothetical protein
MQGGSSMGWYLHLTHKDVLPKMVHIKGFVLHRLTVVVSLNFSLVISSNRLTF